MLPTREEMLAEGHYSEETIDSIMEARRENERKAGLKIGMRVKPRMPKVADEVEFWTKKLHRKTDLSILTAETRATIVGDGQFDGHHTVEVMIDGEYEPREFYRGYWEIE